MEQTPDISPHTLRRLVDDVAERVKKAFLDSRPGTAPHLERAVARLYSQASFLDALVACLVGGKEWEEYFTMRLLATIGPLPARLDLVEALVDRAPNDTDAIRILGAMGPSAATPLVLATLFNTLETPHNDHRFLESAACEALARMGPAFLDTAAVSRLWPKVLERPGVFYWQAQLLGMLAERYPDAPSIRRIREDLRARLESLATDSSRVADLLAVVSSFWGGASDDGLLSALLKVGERDDGLSRGLLIQTIGRIGERSARTPRALELLVAELNGDRFDDAALALWRLSQWIPREACPRVADRLLAYLANGRNALSQEPRGGLIYSFVAAGRTLAAIETCGSSQTAAEQCLDLLGSHDSQRREGVLRAFCSPLHESIRERALSEVSRVLCEDPDGMLRCVAAEVLSYHARWAGRYPFMIDALSRVASWVSVFSCPPDISVGEWALFDERALRREMARPPRLRDGKDLDWEYEYVHMQVRLAAITALGQMGAPAARHPGVRALLRRRGGVEKRPPDWSGDEAAAVGIALRMLGLARPAELEAVAEEIRADRSDLLELEGTGLRILPYEWRPLVISVEEPTFASRRTSA